MGRRRGAIHEAVAKHFHKGTRGYVVISERGTVSGTKRISFDEIERVAADRIILANGTVIPLHRVLYIVDERGRVLWSRYEEKREPGGEGRRGSG